jgi:general stress protein 26
MFVLIIQLLFLEYFFVLKDVSISGRADLVDDNTKKKDLWSDSLKTW